MPAVCQMNGNITKSSAAPKGREIELDFIRGIAILLVIDFHSVHPLLLAPFLWLGFPNFGWAGVDLFFVLSGFLVGGLLVKERKLRGRIDSRRFLIRRGFKIWPQYYSYLAIMLLSGHRSLHSLWGNLLNVQNYVGGVAHTWTLAVEEHAYILLVVILCLATVQRPMRQVFLLLLTIAVAVVANSFVLNALGFNIFTRTDTRVDGIIFGVLLAILYHHAPETFWRLQRARISLLAILLITLSFFRWEPHAPWCAPVNYLLADLSGVSVLLLLYHHNPHLAKAKWYRLIAQIGLYSYGIYLWHVSVMEPIQVATKRLPGTLGLVLEYAAPPIAGVLMGVLFTKVIEFPALKVRDRLFPRRIDSAVGIPAKVEAVADSIRRPESVSF
jgi:peptidoglycan/LPS O-acetylase OafA/YrhL